MKQGNASALLNRLGQCLLAALVASGIGACNPQTTTATSAPPVEAATEQLEYGEWLARPAELASVATNDITRSMRLNGIAMKLGKDVYDKNCAVCHGSDLKGLPEQHTPDLTDTVWRFAGDDLASGGETMFPSDVEWTVRYGIRSGHENARGVEADMLAFAPQYRNERDKSDFGTERTLSPAEVEDVAEYVLKLSGQQADAAKAARGAVLFQDNAKGNCFDCHGEQGTGILAFGSTDLTRKDLYLYGSDRASILDSINKGRVGVMPAFDGKLKPEEIRAVSIFVFAFTRRQP